MSLCFGDFELDSERRLLLRGGVPVPLERKAYELLNLLVERRPRALSRAQIRDVVWPGTHVSESTLAVVVTAIRQALGDDARRPRFVRTVHGFGYAFCAEARSVADRPPDAPEATRDGRGEDIVDARPGGAPEDARTGAGASSRATHLARWAWVVAAAAALAVLSAGWQWFGARRPPVAEEAPKVVPLTSLPGAELHPALSPDGRRVAFIWNGPGRDNFDVYVKEIASGEMRRVTTDPAPDYHPVWSPDGNHLAFVRDGAASATLLLVPAAGGPEQRLTDIAVPDWLYLANLEYYWLDWSPDGRYLALSDRAPDGSWGVFLVSVETGEKRALTSAPSTADRFPTFSPDGRKLAFLRGSFYVVASADLFVLPLSNGATLTAAASAAAAVRGLPIGPIAWLPSGNELVVARSVFRSKARRPARSAFRVVRYRRASRTWSPCPYAAHASCSARRSAACSSSACHSTAPAASRRRLFCGRRAERRRRRSHRMGVGSPSRPGALAKATSGSATLPARPFVSSRLPSVPRTSAVRAGRPTGAGSRSTPASAIGFRSTSRRPLPARSAG